MGDAVALVRRALTSRRLVLLVVVLLLMASGATVLIRWREQGQRDQRAAAELTRSVQAQLRLDDQRRVDTERGFREEDFPARYQRVIAADRATDAAYQQWTTVPGTTFKQVSQSVQRCFGAVDTYDVVAARYPQDLFEGVAPTRIDLSDDRTDCGRAFWGQL